MMAKSNEYRLWYLTGKCPHCGRFNAFTDFLNPDGQIIPYYRRSFDRQRGTSVRCRKCGDSWPMFDDGLPVSTIPVEVQVIETDRTEESLGDEDRTIDNSQTDIASRRRLRAAMRWVRTYAFEIEDLERSSHDVNLSSKVLSLKSTTEIAIKEKYSINDSKEELFEEELDMTVPGRTAVQVRLHWKRIWQNGVVELGSPGDEAVRVPFRVLAGVTFDQEIVDRPS